MPVGTVRGRYELDAPALRTLKDLERQGIRTQKQLQDLGRTMDQLGGARAKQRIESYTRDVRQLGRTTEEMAKVVDSAWTKSTRKVERETAKQEVLVQGLQEKVEAYGRTRASATVNVNGVAESLAELRALDAALDRIDHRRATARAGIGGGLGGGGGGGGRPGGAFSRGRFGAALRYAPALLPAATGLLGGTGALLGSAGSATLGAAALAPPALGALGFGIGAEIGVAKPALAALKEVTKQQALYNKTVRQYGADSKQAQTQQKKLTELTNAQSPAIRRINRDLRTLGQRWRRDTRPGQRQFQATLAEGIQAGLGAEKFVAPAANQIAEANRNEAFGLGQFLAGNRGRQFTQVNTKIYTENLHDWRRTIENIFVTFTNLERAARPFFRRSTQGIEKWTRGWKESTNDIEKTRAKMDKMESNLRTWIRLGGAAWRLTRDLLGAGAPEGQSMVERLTNTLNRWDRWVKGHPHEVRDYFHRAVMSTEALATSVGKIIKLLHDLGTGLEPILTGFLTLANTLNTLGIGGGVGTLLALRRYGIGGGGRGGAGGPGIMPIPLGGGGRGAVPAGGVGFGPAAAVGLGAGAAAGRAGRAAYGAGFRYGGPTSQTAGRAYGLGRFAGFGRGALRFGGQLAAAQALYGFASFPGALDQRVQAAASGVLPFIPQPVSGAQRRDQGAAKAEDYLSKISTDPRRARGAIQRQMQRAAYARVGSTQYAGLPGLEAAAKGGDTRAKYYLSEYHSLARALKDVNVQIKDLNRQKVDKTFMDLAKSYDILRKKFGSRRALESFSKGLVQEIRKGGRDGGLQMARNGARWVKEMRKTGQLTKAQAREANRAIVKSFKDMGRTVTIVNGEVLTGSKREWTNIQQVLSTRAEKARQEVTASFTAIQQKAIGSLRSMGFSATEAKALVAGAEKGGSKVLAMRASAGPGGTAGHSAAHTGSSVVPPKARGGRFARGGYRLPGTGRQDTVPMADGGMGAPGEPVLTRHQESFIDQFLRPHGVSVDQTLKRVRTPHSAPPHRRITRKDIPSAWIKAGILPDADIVRRARGGRTGASAAGPLGGGSGAMGAMVSAANAIDARHYPYVWGGGHNASFSGPYDCSGAVSAVLHAGGALGSPLVSGQMMSLGSAGSGPVTLYANPGHVYMSLNGQYWGTSGANPGGGAGWFPGGPRPGFAVRNIPVSGAAGPFGGLGTGGVQQISLKAPKSRFGAVPGALSTRAGQIYAGGLETKVNEALSKMGGAVGGTTGGNLDAWLTRALQITGHFSPANLAALRGRAMQESGGNPNAINRWDSNARAGHPSQGLLQTIPSTFAAYRDPRVPGGILDPVANAVAAINYMFARYHHIVGPGGGGYARGGRRRAQGYVGGFRTGGAFETLPGRSAQFTVGEGLQREEAYIRPIRPRRKPGRHVLGGGGVQVAVDMRGMSVSHPADEKRLADRVAKKAGEAVLAAITSGNETSDEDLA